MFGLIDQAAIFEAPLRMGPAGAVSELVAQPLAGVSRCTVPHFS
jgi:hypothetical protein